MTLRYPSLSAVPQHLLKPREPLWSVPVEAEKPKRKYRNQPMMYDGKRFDSKLEWRCYQSLHMRWRAGSVLWFTRQVPFELEGGVVYRADFLSALKDGGVEVLDATGKLTQVKINKLKQMKARYGIDVILWSDKK